MKNHALADLSRKCLRELQTRLPKKQYLAVSIKDATILSERIPSVKHLPEIVNGIAEKCRDLDVVGFAELPLLNGSDAAIRLTDSTTKVSFRLVQEYGVEGANLLISVGVK